MAERMVPNTMGPGSSPGRPTATERMTEMFSSGNSFSSQQSENPKVPLRTLAVIVTGGPVSILMMRR